MVDFMWHWIRYWMMPHSLWVKVKHKKRSIRREFQNTIILYLIYTRQGIQPTIFFFSLYIVCMYTWKMWNSQYLVWILENSACFFFLLLCDLRLGKAGDVNLSGVNSHTNCAIYNRFGALLRIGYQFKKEKKNMLKMISLFSMTIWTMSE